MRLSKVLHPEIVLGRRGPDWIKDYYKKTVKEIDFLQEGGASVPHIFAEIGEGEIRGLTLMRKWMITGTKVYHVSSDFLSALAGIERGVSLDYLPDRFCGYLSFAEKTIYDDEDEIEGAYCFIGPARETSLQDHSFERVFWCAYVVKGYRSIGTICLDLKQGELLEDLINRFEDDSLKQFKFATPPKNLRKRALVHNAVLNVVMYLHSQEPKVQRIPATQEISNKKASELEASTGLRNDCTLPVTFVNWNYAKQRIYTKESTWVDTFPRWQPCGPNLSQVKLIWVQPHERRYKTSNEE